RLVADPLEQVLMIAQRLRITEEQIPARQQTLGETLDHLSAARTVEIDEHVATQDEIEAARIARVGQIFFLEAHPLAQGIDHLRARTVDGKPALADLRREIVERRGRVAAGA